MRKYLVALVLLSCLMGILYLFWSQELKYFLPTPVPVNYNPPELRQQIDLRSIPGYPAKTAMYLHFFNPDCPCSRFNQKHFNSLVREYSGDVKVFAVIPAYADVERARGMIDDKNVTVLQDHSDLLAVACGVYSTPQAVIIDANEKLFYRGNYNKSRYCTLKESNYAEIALHALRNGLEPPPSNPLASKAYGCELPSETGSPNILTILP